MIEFDKEDAGRSCAMAPLSASRSNSPRPAVTWTTRMAWYERALRAGMSRSSKTSLRRASAAGGTHTSRDASSSAPGGANLDVQRSSMVVTPMTGADSKNRKLFGRLPPSHSTYRSPAATNLS
jgi:hypothetical protein